MKPVPRIVQLMHSAQSDLELAASELNEVSFQLQAARGKVEADAGTLRQISHDTRLRLSYVLAVALAATASAERLDVAAQLIEDTGVAS